MIFKMVVDKCYLCRVSTIEIEIQNGFVTRAPADNILEGAPYTMMLWQQSPQNISANSNLLPEEFIHSLQ